MNKDTYFGKSESHPHKQCLNKILKVSYIKYTQLS